MRDVSGAFLANMLGINFGGWIGSLLVSTVGAVVLLVIYGLIASLQPGKNGAEIRCSNVQFIHARAGG